VAAQIAAALAAAHAEGVVHRDIKPENVMLRPDGFVKVLDFGLAKLNEEAGKHLSQAPTLAVLKTDPGVVMGTVSYMSPEQARGRDVDGRTDIWSLGVVLYEALAGRAPFRGESPTDVLASVVGKEPAPLFSRDGAFVYYLKAPARGHLAALYRIPKPGGGETKLVEGISLQDTRSNFSLSPDGKRVAFIKLDDKLNRSLVVANHDGGAPRVIYEATPQGLERFEDWMATGSTMSPLREELHLKLALSQPRNLPRLIQLTYEQEQACLERLEQHLGGAAFDDLLASTPPWSAVASVMVRDADVAHLQATVEWLRRIREAMRWMQARPEAPRSRT